MGNDTKKIGLFNLAMLVIGSMIGAGLLVVPNQLIPYGFPSVVGWIIAALCGLVFAKIFVDIALFKNEPLPQIIAGVSGPQLGFISTLSHWLFITCGSSVILFGFIHYLFEFLNLDHATLKFVVASLTIILLNIMHLFTAWGFQILSSITILKLILFGTCALFGMIQFNPLYVFGTAYDAAQPIVPTILKALSKDGSLITGILLACQAASIALFAFAGLESAAASSEKVKNPKFTIPRATIFGLLITSIIYFFTYVCVVSALEGTFSETPVKTAMVLVSNKLIGPWLAAPIGYFISIVAVLGCLGTLIGLVYISPNILFNGLRLAKPSLKMLKSKTDLPLIPAFISLGFILLMTFLKYMTTFDLSLLSPVSCFFLTYFYSQCVLAHFRLMENKWISSLGLVACVILLAGCNIQSIQIAFIVHFIFQILFGILTMSEERKVKVLGEA